MNNLKALSRIVRGTIPSDAAGVYRLRYGGKDYIGSSAQLDVRLNWWRSTVLRMGFTAKYQILILCSKEHLKLYEARCVTVFKSNIIGWNQTSTGTTAGPNLRIRERISATSRERFDVPGYRERRSKQQKEQWKNAAYREAVTAKHRLYKHTEEAKRKISDSKVGKKRPPHVGLAVAAANRLRRKLSELQA